MAKLVAQQPLYNNCYNESGEWRVRAESFPELPELSKMSRIQEPLGLPVNAHHRHIQSDGKLILGLLACSGLSSVSTGNHRALSALHTKTITEHQTGECLAP